MSNKNAELKLSIVITIVGGKKCVRRCLTALDSQVDYADTEIIVPYDKYSRETGELAAEFPEIYFHYIEDLDLADAEKINSRQHKLYDRRRAVGLSLARGQIVAMTEDHALPANDWCRQILSAHEKPYTVIGGAIENAIDSPLNWAWYLCDFGRYGQLSESAEAEYVSDVNVSYKRDALFAVKELWHEAYQETSVHWAMRKRGVKLFLDEKIIVFQNRPSLSLSDAWRERVNWGRAFAETRVVNSTVWQRFIFAIGTIFLPPLLFFRAVRNMRRQKITFGKMVKLSPLIFFLLIGWSAGEFLGYLLDESITKTSERQNLQNSNKLGAENFIR